MKTAWVGGLSADFTRDQDEWGVLHKVKTVPLRNSSRKDEVGCPEADSKSERPEKQHSEPKGEIPNVIWSRTELRRKRPTVERRTKHQL